VDVTLDNSRSQDETTYLVSAGDASAEEPAYDETFVVAAGDVQTVLVPVTEDSEVLVAIADDELIEETEGEEGVLAVEYFPVNCTPGSDEPTATIGEVDCETLTVPVTLDNTASIESTRFIVLSGTTDADEATYEEEYELAPGEKRVVRVPVPNDAEAAIVVSDSEDGDGDLFEVEIFDVACAKKPAPRAIPRFDGVADAGLANTGAGGIQLVALAALLLLSAGGMLNLLGRRE
jgi:hypothetical protein